MGTITGIRSRAEDKPLDVLMREHGNDPFKLWRATGILLSIGGGAGNPSGYNETADLPITTIDGVDLGRLYDEIQRSIALVNRARRPLIDALVYYTDDAVVGIPQLVSNDFEEADEFGQPVGIRPGPRWNLGFSLGYWDLAIRFTFRFLGHAKAEDIRNLHNQALEANERLIYRIAMGRLFRNVTDTHTLEGGTSVNVYPFYNGSNPVAPPQWKTVTHTTSHDHFLVSGGASVDSGDLNAMYRHIQHHGYTEGARVILVVNTQEADIIRSFRVSSGDKYDFVQADNGISFFVQGQLIGGQPTNDTNFPGFIGKYGPISVVEEELLPAGYMVMWASGGEFADRNPIGLRRHPNAALRGLKLIPQFERYPLRESFYHHALGSGVRHRGAGVVMQVKASGSYEIPSISMGGPGGQ